MAEHMLEAKFDQQQHAPDFTAGHMSEPNKDAKTQSRAICMIDDTLEHTPDMMPELAHAHVKLRLSVCLSVHVPSSKLPHVLRVFFLIRLSGSAPNLLESVQSAKLIEEGTANHHLRSPSGHKDGQFAYSPHNSSISMLRIGID